MKEASEGARYERKAIRTYLRRLLNQPLTPPAESVTKQILDWVLARQQRYDKRKGGL